eukprot:1993430-Rhodomonas_salina.5
MATILRKAIAAEAAFMSKKRRTKANLMSYCPSSSASTVRPKEEAFTFTSSQCSDADTDERASAASPSFSQFATGLDYLCIRGDDEELEAKLAKERFSAEGLPSLSPPQRPPVSSLHAHDLVDGSPDRH